MLVVATAGHVDHGKTTLLRALTGMEPDRLAEERRRGLTIELGYVWTTLADGSDVAFVDVPGHERFLPTMLAGVGSVPAVLFVVAADEGWRQQSEEHLVALTAVGVRHGVVAVTRCDLADPGPAIAQIKHRLAGGPLAGAAVVPVAAPVALGLDRLRTALWRMSALVPPPDAAADVRMWLDRAFSMRGAGTVVTGTLPAGRVSVGDRLRLLPGGTDVAVRSIQTLRRDVAVVSGVARVALNLRRLAPADVPRGGVLTTPGRFVDVSVVDVRLLPPAGLTPDRHERAAPALPVTATIHVGATAVSSRVRPLPGARAPRGADGADGADAADAMVRERLGHQEPMLARLRLSRPLPLRIGDRLLLRDPGSRAVWGADVLDVEPPPLLRRGQAAARSQALRSALDGMGPARAYVRARGLVRVEDLTRVGLPEPGELTRAGRPEPGDLTRVRLSEPGDMSLVGPAGSDDSRGDSGGAGNLDGTTGGDGLVVRAGWVAEPAEWARLAELARAAVAAHDRAHPLRPGLPLDELGHALGGPDPAVVGAIADEAGLTLAGGRVCRPGTGPVLDDRQAAAVGAVRQRLAKRPFDAPTAAELDAAGLAADVLAAAELAGLVWRPAPGLVLLPSSDVQAIALLARLAQPFTVSQAAQALGCTRRVAVPLLEWLDRAGATRRDQDARRTVRAEAGPAGPTGPAGPAGPP